MNEAIRSECLQPAENWQQPTGQEVKAILKQADLKGSEAAALLGLGEGGSRTIRRWTGQESKIPYAAWALLCWFAGHGVIWDIDNDR